MTKNESVSSALVDKLRGLSETIEKLIQEVEEEGHAHPIKQESDAVFSSASSKPKTPELSSEYKNNKLKTFCTSQKAMLYQSYVDLGGEIDRKRCRAIAKELQVSEERIRKWFSNKKQRDKRRMRICRTTDHGNLS